MPAWNLATSGFSPRSVKAAWAAEDTRLHRKVAIKVLYAESISDKDANQRLLREAQAAAKLEHPNICAAAHEVAEDEVR